MARVTIRFLGCHVHVVKLVSFESSPAEVSYSRLSIAGVPSPSFLHRISQVLDPAASPSSVCEFPKTSRWIWIRVTFLGYCTGYGVHVPPQRLGAMQLLAWKCMVGVGGWGAGQTSWALGRWVGGGVSQGASPWVWPDAAPALRLEPR